MIKDRLLAEIGTYLEDEGRLPGSLIGLCLGLVSEAGEEELTWRIEDGSPALSSASGWASSSEPEYWNSPSSRSFCALCFFIRSRWSFSWIRTWSNKATCETTVVNQFDELAQRKHIKISLLFHQNITWYRYRYLLPNKQMNLNKGAAYRKQENIFFFICCFFFSLKYLIWHHSFFLWQEVPVGTVFC